MRGKDLSVVCALKTRRKNEAEEEEEESRGEPVCLGGVSLLFQVCTEEERRGRGQTAFGCAGMWLRRRKRGFSAPLRCSVAFLVAVLVFAFMTTHWLR